MKRILNTGAACQLRRLGLILLLILFLFESACAGTGQRIAEQLRARHIPPELIVVLVTMLPVVELRGALPIGYNLLGLPLGKVLLLSIAGNMIPIFFVLLFLEKAVTWLSRLGLFYRFFNWLFRRTRARTKGLEQDEFWGLTLFVGIPLPGTGAWTGAVAAVLLGLPYWRALLAIFTGVVMAAGAVSIPCVLFRRNTGLGMVLVITILSGLLVWLIIRAVRRVRSTVDGQG
ncbi:MAG: small multi-drug export protein [candidate division WOR-3 bacterium]